MTQTIDRETLRRWCSIPHTELGASPTRIPFRIVETPADMGRLMADELVDLIVANNAAGNRTRAIVPCGPTGWYAPFASAVNERRVSLANLDVLHMDEMLDWQARPLPANHPFNFRTYMERHFYGPIAPDLAVPRSQRHWLLPSTIDEMRSALAEGPIDVTIGGWGQDGHVAYNQARRNLYSALSLEDLRTSTIRVQDNNPDTILALSQRQLGGAYQLVPPMSISLGMAECLAARRVRLYSDTGAWKQTAFRVALFSPPTPEYPMTLLQEHPDAVITATVETARHPIAEHPEWVFD